MSGNDLLIVCVIMAAAGALGGFANFLTSATPQQIEPGSTELKLDKPLNAGGYILLGVIAAFIVPLFLTLAQSDLTSKLATSGQINFEKILVFVGFCLVAGISSRAFIQSVSSRVIAIANQAKQISSQAKQISKATEEHQNSIAADVEELTHVVGSHEAEVDAKGAIDSPEEQKNLLKDDQRLKAISDDEYRVLQAFRSKPFFRRTVKGIANDSGFKESDAKALSETKAILGRLLEMDLVREIPSKKTNNLLYQLTAKGAALIQGRE